jgi:Fe-S-cluster containining protein
MRTLPVVKSSFEKEDLCKPCGGLCCQNYPGAAFPENFGAPDEQAMQSNLLEALMSGRWAIDSAECGKYIRPSIKDEEGNLNQSHSFGWYKVCTFWSKENGCEIFSSRPTGCRGLEPLPLLTCEVRYGNKDASSKAWKPYHKLIEALIEVFTP